MVSKYTVPSECETCGGQLIVGGPIWSDAIYDKKFVRDLFARTRTDKKFKYLERIQGILAAMIDESILHRTPLSYAFDRVCKNVKIISPPKEVLQ